MNWEEVQTEIMARPKDTPGRGAATRAGVSAAAAAAAAAKSRLAPRAFSAAGGRQEAGRRAAAAVSERDAAAIMRQMLSPHGGRQAPDDVGYMSLRGATKGSVRAAVNIDTLVQSTDMPPGMTLRQAARKSVVACASDFAAKGIKPTHGTISVSMPKGTGRPDVFEIARGVAGGARSVGISIIAGDMNAGKEFAFTVCIVGAAPASLKATGRGGAAPGDLIFASGPFGYTGLGLDLLLRDGDSRAEASHKRIEPPESRAKRSVLCPSARIEFGLRCSGYFTSSMDSSDGLASTLNEMACQSKCEFEVSKLPVTRQLSRYARRNGLDLHRMALYGGEEYEIVFTASPGARGKIMEAAEHTRTPVIEIGSVLAPKGRSGAGGAGAESKKGGLVCMRLSDDQVPAEIADLGWDHFAA